MNAMSSLEINNAKMTYSSAQVEGLDYQTTIGTVLIRINLNIIWGLFLALGDGIFALVRKNK